LTCDERKVATVLAPIQPDTMIGLIRQRQRRLREEANDQRRRSPPRSRRSRL